MLAILLITVLFVVISVIFFFRAEKLQDTLLKLNREKSNSLKENTALTKTIALIASNHEEFAKSRLKHLLVTHNQHNHLDNIDLIKPLIHNYVIIFSDCLKEKGKMHSTTKKCFEGQNSGDYKEFVNKVIKTDDKLKRLWGSNNLTGFVSLVEALLVKYNEINDARTSTKDDNVDYCQ